MAERHKEKKNSGLKRDVVEVGIFVTVVGVIYMMGWHTEIIGTLQRGLLATRIIQPDINLDESEFLKAEYNMPLITLDGERTSFQAYEGKTIFLNFWATWCPPCIAEMPNIQKLYESFEHNDEIVFVMLSLDENHNNARAFMERKNFTLPVFFLVGRKPSVYNSTAIPTTYVISPDGYIVTEKRGMANYNTESFKKFLLSF